MNSSPHVTSARSFGQLLRLLRKQARLTQRDLAARVGYSAEQISRLETGARAPDRAVVATRFVDALGIADDDRELADRLLLLADSTHVSDGAYAPKARTHVPGGRLFGRQQDLATVQHVLASPDVRLLTLLGSPGIGKTRLSVALIETIAPDFEHGGLFVPLAAFGRAQLLPAAMLQALGVAATGEPREQLRHALAGKTMLLILDNIEQLLADSEHDQVVSLVVDLLAANSGLKILVTSRVALHISLERVFVLPELTPAAASELFLDRALAQQPNWTLDARQRAAVVAICERLGHVPLAIELAASRSRIFDPVTLFDRLVDPLNTLVHGPRDLPVRHRTLRAAIAWSYALLSPGEQTIFCIVGALADGCALSMLEAIAADLDAQTPVPQLVESLLAKSLLTAHTGERSIYIDMLETLRAYAREQLDLTGQRDDVLRRCAAHYSATVQRARDDLSIGESRPWFDWFTRELNNVRSLVRWSIDSGEISHAMRLMSDLAHTWRYHGPVWEGNALIEEILVLSTERANSEIHADLLDAAGEIATGMGSVAHAERRWQEALTAHERAGNLYKCAKTWANLALVAQYQDNTERSWVCIEQARSLASACGNQDAHGTTLVVESYLALSACDYEQALVCAQQLDTVAQAIRSAPMRVFAADIVARVHTCRDDLSRARVDAQRLLQLSYELGQAVLIHRALGSLGSIALYQHDVAVALNYLREAEALSGKCGHVFLNACYRTLIGFGLHLAGDTDAGLSQLDVAMITLVRIRRLSVVVDSLYWYGCIAAASDDPARAARLFAAADAYALRRSTNLNASDQRMYAPYRERVRLALPADVLADCEAYGAALDDDGATALALSRDVSPQTHFPS